MTNSIHIRVQRLFAVVLVLKVLSSFLGWYFQFPWTLGFGVPLALMLLYIVVGAKRHDKEVSDEKFADSCYYLGFIFTITSIIFSLFDLPSIGTRIQDIAVRFGAAMVSTVLGLGVRVYLVGFQKEVADALRDAEQAVIESSQRFQMQLSSAVEKLQDFESQVDTATRGAIERVNIQIESLGKNYAEGLADLFDDLVEQNNEVLTKALEEVKAASLRLSLSVEGYSRDMGNHVASIEERVIAFTDAITARIESTTFPDDYFSKHLEAPLMQLKDSSEVISATIKQASSTVEESSTVLSTALVKLREKANAAELSMEAVLALTSQQEAVLKNAQSQLNVLGELGTTLLGVKESLEKTVQGLQSANQVTSELAKRVDLVVETGNESTKTVQSSIEQLTAQVLASTNASEALANSLVKTASAGDSIATQFASVEQSAQLIASKLDMKATAELDAAKRIVALCEDVASAVNKVDSSAGTLQAIIQELARWDAMLQVKNVELIHVVEELKTAQSNVESTQKQVDTVRPSHHSPALLAPHNNDSAPSVYISADLAYSGTSDEPHVGSSPDTAARASNAELPKPAVNGF